MRGRGRARGLSDGRGRPVGDGGRGALARPIGRGGEGRAGAMSATRGRGRGRGDDGEAGESYSVAAAEYPTISAPAGPRLILGAKTLSATDGSQHGGDVPASGTGVRYPRSC